MANLADIELFAQPDALQHPWPEHVAQVEEDIGGARFTGRTFEYAQAENARSVCVNFMQWSGRYPYIARILVHYSVGRQPQTEPAASLPRASVLTASNAAEKPVKAARVSEHGDQNRQIF